jgi:hypothetical protein
VLKETSHEIGTQQAGFETISAHATSDHSMKRTYFPGITDIVVVTEPAEIRTISNDSRFDRDFALHGPVHNVQLLRRMLRIFSLNGKGFPLIQPRTDPSRAAAQDELWSRLNVKADVRQAKTSGEVDGCPFKRGSLFILGLGSASKGAANRDLVFLSQSWSRCPAEKWVRALLEGVWTRVSTTLHGGNLAAMGGDG